MTTFKAMKYKGVTMDMKEQVEYLIKELAKANMKLEEYKKKVARANMILFSLTVKAESEVK